ncbi:MAG TPA: hypothetical protein VM347_11535 [Nonomuraea sp.]|nr:hypothetical protein [Nonomuraea sp.]
MITIHAPVVPVHLRRGTGVEKGSWAIDVRFVPVGADQRVRGGYGFDEHRSVVGQV